jgi:DNA replication and repair protein RecF
MVNPSTNAVSFQSAKLTPAVWLREIQLTSFRSYERFSLRLDQGSVVLIGPNGAGKTNLLEAISLLSPGRGLRRAKAMQLPRRNTVELSQDQSTIWSVAAQVETPNGPVAAGTGVLPGGESDNPRRVVRIDGEYASQMALAERFSVSWLTPDMDAVLGAAPSERRRFLDRLVIAFDPAHAGRLQRYEKAARQRGRLMDEGAGDRHWFDALEAQMAEAGVAIIAARQALVAALDKEAAEPLPSFPSARLKLEGLAETWLETMPAVDVEDMIRREASSARLKGDRGLPGPAGSLLTVTHSGTGQTAELSSTGEQKALVISVVLAHARLQARRLQRPPLLLLDDIASHLDAERRAALYDLTSELAGQVWFSGTDRTLFQPKAGEAQFVFLDACGAIRPAAQDMRSVS